MNEREAAMKLRTRFGLYSPVRLGVLHGEKEVFAVAMLFLLANVIVASRRETFPWTPEDLSGMAGKARAHVQATPPPEIPIVRYSEIVKASRRPVSATSYAFRTLFDPPLWRTQKRLVPDVYPVRQLIASAGRGAFATSVAGARNDYGVCPTRGERWVCLTGLIEHDKQTEAFREALWLTTYHEVGRDRPDYVYFRVERAEVEPRRLEAELHWVRQNVRQMFRYQQSWPRCGTELADPGYIPPERGGISLVFPLGPLVDRPWGSEVCHPGIPLRATASTGRPGATYRSTANHPSKTADEPEEPEYLLFRYFDYDVEPGKQYRYRVRLLLANPNYAVAPHCLEEESSAKNQYLETGWSEPTTVVQVPPDTGVLAGPAKTWGARAAVMMTRFLKSTGEVAFEEFHVRRGQVLDFADRVLSRRTAPTQVARVSFVTKGMSPQRPPAAKAERGFTHPTTAPSRELPPGAQAVVYASGMLLLDVRGGDRMPGPDRFTEPEGLLLMDPLGNLVVRNEIDDLLGYRSMQQADIPSEDTYAEKKPAARERGKDTLIP
jgi:hypothetical protein